jgi:hypothetical protein
MEPNCATPAAEPLAFSSEHDALHVHIAVVVAQQAALLEQERHLAQRRMLLEHQEAQVVAHLEEKHRHLEELRLQIQEARSWSQQEGDLQERRLGGLARALDQARSDVADSQQKAKLETRRLRQFRRRLKQRLHRHWAAERQAMRLREQALARGQQRLQLDQKLLAEARLRFHGESELERRQLQALNAALRIERSSWEQRRLREQAALDQRAEQLAHRETALSEADGLRDRLGRQAEASKRRLQEELTGLEQRIHHHRQRLLAFASQARLRAPALAPGPGPAPVQATSSWSLSQPGPAPQRLSFLQQAAASIADQRVQLAEFWDRWSQAGSLLLDELRESMAALESLVRSFQGREQFLAMCEERCLQREEENARRRQHLQRAESQLRLRAAASEADRDHRLADLAVREQVLERRLALISNLRRRWRHCQRHEMIRFRAAADHLVLLHQQWSSVRAECLRRHKAFYEGQCDLAPRALALEQYRQKYIRDGADAARAATRLETLRQRWIGIFERAEERLTQERSALEGESKELQHYCYQLQGLAVAFTSGSSTADRQMVQDHHAALAVSQTAELRAELARHGVQAEVYQRQLQELNAEVERLARLLIDDDDAAPLSTVQAA